MDNSFLYTLPQWFIFAAVFVSVYGWVENKKAFRIIGAVLFVVLGIYSLLVLTGGYLAAGSILTPEEMADRALMEATDNQPPFEALLTPAYFSFVAAAAFAIPAIYLDFKNKKKYRLFIVLAGLIAFLGFFMVVGAIKSL